MNKYQHAVDVLNNWDKVYLKDAQGELITVYPLGPGTFSLEELNDRNKFFIDAQFRADKIIEVRSNKSDQPAGPGFYLFAYNGRNCKLDHHYGCVDKGWERHGLNGRLCCDYTDEYGLQRIWIEDFHKYEWHKVKLPEAWLESYS